MVLNSVFEPTYHPDDIKLMSVELSSSRNILDENSSIDWITDAYVEVVDETTGAVYVLSHIQNGVYKNEILAPQYGHVYSIKASAEGFNDVSATSEVPLAAIISASPTYGDFNDDGQVLTVDLQFQNIEGEQQYYVWEVVSEETTDNGFSFDSVINNPVLLASNDEHTESVLADESFQSRIFLSDDGMSQDKFQSSFSTTVEPKFGAQTSSGSIASDYSTLSLRVMTVSEDLYEYYKSIEVYRLRGTVNTSITQPVNIHSNVEGGLGIFAGFSAKIIHIE